jgi:hypothetical protein
MRTTTIRTIALWCIWGLASGCVGSIGGSLSDEHGFGPGGVNAGEGGAGASNAGAAGSAGAAGGSIDPGDARGPRFSCSDPSTRGQGQLAMRRLTRDELLHSFTAVIGGEVMSASAVTLAASQIPGEPPGDLVATFQNGHAFDHVSGMLQTAQAVASELASSAAARDRVLGACAAEADRACAEAFLDGAALALMRRPLGAERRAALLAAFDAEGGGLPGMQWLLARTLQAPETLFHLELPQQTCESTPGEDLSFDGDDAAVFFSPLATGGEVEPPAELDENGWFVWQIPGARVLGRYTTLRIALTARADDDVPLELDVNLNDTPLLPGITVAPGTQTLEAAVMIESGANVKVGVQYKNAAAGRTLVLERLTLGGDADATACTAVPADGALFKVDAWSVASRLAYAITGQGPDAALLDAAANDQLSSEAEVRPHAERLIATPAARTQLHAVLRAWLNLDAIPTPHDAIAERAGIEPDGLSEEAVTELLDYATYQILDREADTTALMSDAIGFPRSERMATLYGSDVASSDEPVSLPEHGGLLLRIAPLLSGQLSSSPILRGVYVRKRVLCDTLPSPDFSIVNERLDELAHQDKTMATTREAVTAITSVSPCNGCHVSINPIGFALESFDPLGMPRSEELVLDEDGNELARHPIDTRVTAANLEAGLPDELSGADELNEALGRSYKVRACIAERLYTHARLRPSAEPDHCALAALEEALTDGGSIKDAWLAAVVGPELFVREATAEVSP